MREEAGCEPADVGIQEGTDRHPEGFKLKKLIATLGYAGYSPVAPGTAGTAVTGFAYALITMAGVRLGSAAWLVLIGATLIIGVYVSNAMEDHWGKDPGPVVIDEALGYLVTVAWLPQSLFLALAAFFLFRLLDIVKPPPARRCENLRGGWGIMADDLVAGVYGNLILRLLYAVV